MGATFANCHVRADSDAAITRSLQTIIARRAYVFPPKQGWVSVYDETSQARGIAEIGRIACDLSRTCQAGVFAFYVEDSDVLQYQAYDAGELKDEYSSCPEYWGAVPSEERERLSGKPEILVRYSLPGTQLSTLADLLQNKAHILEEERLAQLAHLLGIDGRLACAGFDDMESIDGKIIGDLDKVKLVENKSFSKNANLFIASAEKGDVNSVKRLLSLGVDPNVIDRSGKTALLAAVSGGHIELVEALLDAGAQPSPSALITAAFHGNLAILESLIDAGADPSEKVDNGRDALVSAILSPLGNASDTIRVLIAAGAPVNERYELRYVAPPRVETGRTALMYASYKGDVDVVKILIEAGSDVNVRTAAGETAVGLAKAKTKDEVVAALRAAGAVE